MAEPRLAQVPDGLLAEPLPDEQLRQMRAQRIVPGIPGDSPAEAVEHSGGVHALRLAAGVP